MRVTILGSGDATGVPVPLCGCRFCRESDRRRNPSLLVETRSSTLLFDCGPDIAGQLHEAAVDAADGVFLTHAHGDHSAGVARLTQTAKWDADHLDGVDEFAPTDPDSFTPQFTVYLTDTARSHLRAQVHFERLDVRTIEAREPVSIGDAEVAAVPVEHSRPEYDTMGFTVRTADATIGYAPDMRSFVDGPPGADLDLFVCEGAAILGQPVHGPTDELRSAIDAVDADRTILVNVNEHLQRAHTESLRERAKRCGYELGRDFRVLEP